MDIANIIFTFGIPALVIGSMVWRRLRPSGAQASVTTTAQIDTAALTQATPEAPVAMRAWLDYVNAQPDRVPHVAVIGPSGAGKTTLTTAVLADRQGQIVVLTAKEGDTWGRLPYIGIDLDATYTTANETFNVLEAEVKRRLVAVKQQRMTSDWLTVVLDDFSTLQKECPTAANVVKLVARLGRSLRVRLIMLSDSALVKAIGLEGEGETRSNFAFLRIARGHKGTIEVEGRELPIDTSMVHQLAGRANLAQRAWQQPSDEDAELSAYLGLSESAGAIQGGFRPDRPDQTRQTVQTEPSNRVLMRKYREAGITRDQASKLIRGDGLTFDNNFWSEIGKELDTVNTA